MALIDKKTTTSALELRFFGLIFALFFGFLGALLRWKGELTTAPVVLWWVGGIGALVYYGVPPIRRPFVRLWTNVTYPIGWVLSHVILALVYYLVFTPIGLALRLFGRDAMERRLDPKASTYWKERPPAGDPARYFKQF